MVEFPIRRTIVITCCFLVMLLGSATVLLHEIGRLEAVNPEIHPRAPRDTFLTVGVAVDILSTVFLFLWTWMFSHFRSKRLFQLLPLFLIPGSLCLAAILAWEAHGVSRPESLGFYEEEDDEMVEMTTDSDGSASASSSSSSSAPAEYYREPFAIAALVGVGLMLVANIVIIISVFVYTFDCRYCAFYDHSTYRYGNMKFQVRRISTARAAMGATTVV